MGAHLLLVELASTSLALTIAGADHRVGLAANVLLPNPADALVLQVLLFSNPYSPCRLYRYPLP